MVNSEIIIKSINRNIFIYKLFKIIFYFGIKFSLMVIKIRLKYLLLMAEKQGGWVRTYLH